MHQSEFEGFSAVLKRLAAAFSKKLTDELTQAYWEALRDQSLSTVERIAAQRTRYGKFFPKPAELRPSEAVQEEAKTEEAKRARAIEDGVMRWFEDWRIADPQGWLQRLPKGSGIERLAAQHGAHGIRFDIAARCWRRA